MGTQHWSEDGGTPSPEPSVNVLPAVVRSRSDGSERFICYDDDIETARVDKAWLSVDAGTTVSLESWR